MTEQKTELERNAVILARRKEQESCQRTVDMKSMDNHTEDRHMSSRLASIDQEATMQRQFQQKRAEQAALIQEQYHQMSVSKKFQKMLRRHEKFAMYGVRQKEHPEIREMAKHMEAMYNSRYQQMQQLNHVYKNTQDKEQEKQDYNRFMETIRDHRQEELEKAKEDMMKKQEYKDFLMGQLADREAAKKAEYDQKLADSRVMHDVVKNMHEMELNERLKKKENKERLRKEKVAQIVLQQQVRQQMTRDMMEEERKRERDAHIQDARRKERDALIQSKRHNTELVSQKIGEKILKDKKEAREREDLIHELRVLSDEAGRGPEEVERERETVRRGLRDTLLAQIVTNTTLRERELLREGELRLRAEAKAKEEELKEKAKLEKAKEAKKKYAEELAQQIIENKRRKDEEMIRNAQKELLYREESEQSESNEASEESESEEGILRNVSAALRHATRHTHAATLSGGHTRTNHTRDTGDALTYIHY